MRNCIVSSVAISELISKFHFTTIGSGTQVAYHYCNSTPVSNWQIWPRYCHKYRSI